MEETPAPRRRWAAYSGAAAVLGLLAWSLLSGPEAGLNEGSPAPAFHLDDIAGRPASLSEYRGKVLLIDFWATWCDSCFQELPGLKALHERLRGRPFELLALSLDEDGPAAVSAFAAEHGLPYRIALADAALARSYGVYGIPAKYLIDRDGLVYRRYVGETDASEIESDVRTLLERSPS